MFVVVCYWHLLVLSACVCFCMRACVVLFGIVSCCAWLGLFVCSCCVCFVCVCLSFICVIVVYRVAFMLCSMCISVLLCFRCVCVIVVV